jgi:hypothetical protein
MNQEKQKPKSSLLDKLSLKGKASPTYKVDNERIEQIMKGGFLFGFTISDCFILLSAILTVAFLQLQPYAIPYLESLGQSRPPTQIIKDSVTTPTLTSAPSTTSAETEEKRQESTESSALKETPSQGEKVYCISPRPQVCTQECIIGPPFICGSDGKSHCTICQACSNPEVQWYVFQDEPCPDIAPSL